MIDDPHIPTIGVALASQEKPFAIATVIETWGSSPRAVGSQLLVEEDGTFYGSVSGGCVEGAVILEAQASIGDSEIRVLEYGVADDDAFAVGLACGGTIRILVEPFGAALSLQHLRAYADAWASRRPLGMSVDLKSGVRAELTTLPDAPIVEGQVFHHVQSPPMQLIVIGAVHIAQFLAPIARAAGYQVVIIDPREGFASRARFPHETLVIDWPDDGIASTVLDAQTAVVTLTHDPKMDLPALHAALTSDAFYIGALGSTRTHAKRCATLKEDGLDDDQIARISGPVGLDIGSIGPAEIAVSIMAEIIAKWRSGR